MNVTVSIDKALCVQARHRAVDEGLSLSSWISKTISKEINAPSVQSKKTLLEALADKSTEDRDIEFPRSEELTRGIDFS